MRCRLCGERAGWWRRRCADCNRLLGVWQACRGGGPRRVLAALQETGIAPDRIERFLDGEPDPGGGTVRDLIAADMSNQLLAALGRAPAQTGAEVKRLRARGAWRQYDRRPED
jgi:hypothetical protein